MTISAVSSSSNPLISNLEANGLSASKAKLVDSDLQDAVKQVSGSSTSGSGPVSKDSVRKALDAKIDADVKAGKLSADDAAAVKKTLDQMDQQSGSAPAAPAGGAQGGGKAGGGGGGGGGGGSAQKTEVSETVTVSGSTKTTVITYSDDTNETTTTTATEADVEKYGKPSETSTSSSSSSTSDTSKAAQDYLSSIESGTLIDQTA